VLRQTVVSLARMSDPDLADWIGETCSFPNSMVDCIVPATGPKELALAREFGVDDAAPVAHENFRQWVVEDDFCAGRPDWDAVGATFSDDVHSYELMKLRILNAGHQVVANPGEILSLNTIADCMQHTRIAAFFRKVETEEIAPRVAPVPGMAPLDYVALIDRRFSNPYIEDTTRRVAFDGAARHTGFVLPMIREALEADGPLEGLALTEALWARMCEGTREDGSTIEPNDPQWETLTATAKAARSQPRAWIDARRLYGDLAEAPRFAEAFERWLALIWSKGVETALDRYIAG
ncbi:MAG: mannitol dehydrogenase family protein, partial [Pseudomonadota bacterium]